MNDRATHSPVPELRLLPPSVRDIAALPRIQSSASRWDTYSCRPGYGITPDRVWRIFRSAEMGMPREQNDLFEDILENDGHLQGLVNNRIETISGREWLIKPGDSRDARSVASAMALQSAMRRANAHEFIEHQLMTFWWGYAASEPIWEFVDGWWVPTHFVNMPPQRFVFDENDYPRLTTDTNPWPGEALLPSWVFSIGRHRRAVRAGAGRCATWWSTFKRMSVRDWIIFAEKFGIPIPMGVWRENAGEETRKMVEQAVIDIGEAGQAAMSDAAKIIFADVPMRSGDATALHPSVVNLCNTEMSKLITGATLSVETGGPGSFALGKVHEARGLALQVADAKRFATKFEHTVGVMFNAMNGLAELPPSTIDIAVLPDVDPLTRAKVLSILANELGMTLDSDQMRQDFKVRAPAGPETELRGTKSSNGPQDQPVTE